ncbi:hypothetical protein [Pseudofulvibacter geojedonensis]|uniref:DUF4129 domain-containing protein n=1 Tax=Pseudofulvibacter geojedonensis TaxID=1123758 RepID=A0ABW3I057_9FLAO
MSFSQYEEETAIDTPRSFKKPLKEKYNSGEFIYIEPEAPKPKPKTDFSWFTSILNFLFQWGFYVIAIIAVLIIIKLILDQNGFSVFSKTPKKTIEKLDLTNEELIENINIDELLQQAINNKEYRLAVRYYFLTILKELNLKKQIKLDKDKTNSDYLFEISKDSIRKQFSYTSYVYDYVWYGEFKLEDDEFNQIQNSFINFKKDIN